MSRHHPDCEAFFRYLRAEVDSECLLAMCADALWHEVVWQKAASRERKQRFGIYSWLVWWVCSLRNCDRKAASSATEATFGSAVFGVLDTPAHLNTLEPIVKEFRFRYPTEIVCPSRALLPTLAFEPPVIPASIKHSWKILGLTFRALRLTRLFWHLYGRKLGCRLRGRIAARIYLLLTAIAWAEGLAPVRGPLFVTYEFLPWQKALVRLWRKSGQRVIHVLHGQRLDFYQHTHATDLVLLSNIDEPWFRARVDPSVKLWTVGHPRLEDVRRKVGTPRETNTGLPRITFFSQPAEGDYSRSQRIADWQICASLQGKAEVRFRAHPREDRAMLVVDMKAAGIEFMQVSDAGLIEDLKWCDAVASSWSTVSMEAAACGRGIFWTCSTPEKYEASQELRDHGIGVLIQNAPDWTPYLRQWSEGGWKSPVTVSNEQLRELGMIGDTSKSWMERLEVSL